ncbi:cyclophilin-like fold protein [Tomitella biformata]|uniref:cyclophilin-like fold protein n=1 Tax=Tomitella biformata TaxID=630403 RepID=UPI000467682A|nr:cyclophilin-like fold protein [Tomitella biformata]
MRIQLTIGGELISGELYDHPVAREFAAMLPVTLTFQDFNAVEKLAPLARALTLDGVPSADAPEPGEIGYHAPSQNLVLYYDSPGGWPGLVRMGRLACDVDVIRDLADGTAVQIEHERHP